MLNTSRLLQFYIRDANLALKNKTKPDPINYLYQMDFNRQIEKLKNENKLIRDLFALSERYKKYFPLIAFIIGFSWDTITLSRIDRVIDNMRLLLYLFLLCFFIIVTNFIDREVITKGRLLRFKDYYLICIHFLIGSLFSAYVVFYFQSASLSKNILFVIILAFFLVAIEFLNNRLKNIYFQLGLLFLVNFAYFTFFVPIITKSMSIYSFMTSGVISLLIVGGVIFLFYKKAIFLSLKQVYLSVAMILAIFTLLNILYIKNLIPPVPLSLKTGGVYHSVAKKGQWYVLEYEKAPWYKFWTEQDAPFHFGPDDQIIGFTSIYAPSELKQEIVHHWQRYINSEKGWVTYDQVSFTIEGGRENGFRAFSRKKFIANGQWRIEVRTKNSRLLGRVYFDVEQVKEPKYQLAKRKL